jgi:hypothetical protein
MGNHGIKYTELTKDTLEQLYINERKSITNIAKIIGCSVALVSNRIKSYGMKIPTQNKYLNKTFGYLKVKSYHGQNNHHRACYKCECICGQIKVIDSSALNNNRGTKSCGCKAHPICMKTHGDIPLVYFEKVKVGAKSRNLELLITIEDIWNKYLEQGKKCALSGLDITFQTTYNGDTTASLDRIDSSKGYTIDNIQWLHKDVNVMKWDFDINYFTSMCAKIYKHKGITC